MGGRDIGAPGAHPWAPDATQARTEGTERGPLTKEIWPARPAWRGGPPYIYIDIHNIYIYRYVYRERERERDSNNCFVI